MIRWTLLALTLTAATALADDPRLRIEALRAEPTARETQEAALGFYRIGRDSVDSMRRRSAWKAILPVTEVSGGFAKADTDETSTNAEVLGANEPWITRATGGKGYDVRGKLTWNLPQLVFNAEELDVASVATVMEGVVKDVTRLYFLRRRLQIELALSPPADQATMLQKELRLDELTSLLDAMTGGWFGRELALRSGRPAGVER